jgi:hypothetical protein
MRVKRCACVCVYVYVCVCVVGRGGGGDGRGGWVVVVVGYVGNTSPTQKQHVSDLVVRNARFG